MGYKKVEVDKRVKLTKEQKEEIIAFRQLHGSKRGYGDRVLAEMYGVSRRTIQFILDPNKLEVNRAIAKQRKIK
jgi:hypothetical protein